MPVLLMVLAVQGGCKQYATATFQVTVTNSTPQPLSVGLVKNGPPFESEWAAPHEIAIALPDSGGRRWGELVPPGKSATLGPMSGKFDREVSAILRAYRGNPTIDDLLAVPAESADRVDIYLQPGQSAHVIRADGAGRLASPSAQQGR